MVLHASAFALGSDVLLLYFINPDSFPVAVGWGLVAILLHLTGGAYYDVQPNHPFSTYNSLLSIPICLQELVLAVWLIVKGFNPSAVASLSAKTATNELLSAA